MPAEDGACFGIGTIRCDGRKLHPGYLFEVKKPGESTAPWDYLRQLAAVPAEEAFRRTDASACYLDKT